MHSLITYIHPHTYVPTHTQIHTRPQNIGKEKRILQLNRKPKLYFLRLERMVLTVAALTVPVVPVVLAVLVVNIVLA